MSHSQFHSTKLFILRPYDSRIRTLGDFCSPPRYLPRPALLPRVTAGLLHGRLWLSPGDRLYLKHGAHAHPSAHHHLVCGLHAAGGGRQGRAWLRIVQSPGFLPSGGRYTTCCSSHFRVPAVPKSSQERPRNLMMSRPPPGTAGGACWRH
jgi:hypothetical protein